MDHFFDDSDFSSRVKELIRQIPYGKVATYGQIAFLAGHAHGTRQVVWILHACSEKDNLPWHRVINKKGTISLKPNAGFEKQKELLEREGVVFNQQNQIDLDRFLWDPDSSDLITF